MMQMVRTLILAGLMMSVWSAPARAQAAQCGGTFVNPITDICWSCLFPISLGAIPIWPSDRPDTSNPSSPICVCPMSAPPFVRVGLSVASRV